LDGNMHINTYQLLLSLNAAAAAAATATNA